MLLSRGSYGRLRDGAINSASGIYLKGWAEGKRLRFAESLNHLFPSSSIGISAGCQSPGKASWIIAARLHCVSATKPSS